MSRSTHYQLTDEEVETLKQEPRVLDIHQPYYDLGMKIVPCVTQNSSHWSKGGEFISGSPEMNWGLLRCVEGKTRDNWGSDDNTTVKQVSGEINLPNTGRHVDVVIIDGPIRPGHPEFAKNADGTGGSRVKEYDWFTEHGAEVLGTRNPGRPYSYVFPEPSVYDDIGQNHGAQCASQAAGNTCGFARSANIYNIAVWSNDANPQITLYNALDFVTEFHKNKKINEATGRRNPTVVSMSYTLSPQTAAIKQGVTQIQYGNRPPITRPATGWSEDDFRRVGIQSYTDIIIYVPGRDTGIDEDIRDAIAAGIICVASAANDSAYIDIEGGDLYNNSFTLPTKSNDPIFYMQGSSPGGSPGVICVGAVDSTVVERKAYYSNKGPGVDIYAPATNTIAARNTYEYADGPYILTRAPATPGVTCTFVSYPRSVNEGQVIDFEVTTTGIPSGSEVQWYWNYDAGPGPGRAARADFTVLPQGKFYVDSSGRGSFNITIQADMWTEGAETFTVSVYDPADIYRQKRPIATTEPITIVDTSTGTQGPPGIDPRNRDYYKGRFGGTSAACPHVAGIIACALETYPNMTQMQALSYIQTYANHGVLRDIPLNTDYDARQWFNDEHILFNGPNKYATYQPNTRPNQVQPIIGHQSRPLTGAVYPRPRTKRML
jgi:hypothetical protein